MGYRDGKLLPTVDDDDDDDRLGTPGQQLTSVIAINRLGRAGGQADV